MGPLGPGPATMYPTNPSYEIPGYYNYLELCILILRHTKIILIKLRYDNC